MSRRPNYWSQETIDAERRQRALAIAAPLPPPPVHRDPHDVAVLLPKLPARRPSLDRAPCLWCGGPIIRVRNLGTPKKFCKMSCRTAFYEAARQWGAAEALAGRVSMATLRRFQKAPTVACTLILGAKSPAAVSPPLETRPLAAAAAARPASLALPGGI